MHDEKLLNKAEELAYKGLSELVEKGELTHQSLDDMKDCLCILEYIPDIKKKHYMDDSMMESGRMYPHHPARYYDIRSYDGYDNWDSYDYGMSERRGRSPMTGQYTSNASGMMPNGYSMSMNGNVPIQPDVTSMMQQLMTRMDKLEKK